MPDHVRHDAEVSRNDAYRNWAECEIRRYKQTFLYCVQGVLSVPMASLTPPSVHLTGRMPHRSMIRCTDVFPVFRTEDEHMLFPMIPEFIGGPQEVADGRMLDCLMEREDGQ